MTTPNAGTYSADAQAPDAPADMGAACVEAVDAALSQRESEAGKVAMGGVQ